VSFSRSAESFQSLPKGPLIFDYIYADSSSFLHQLEDKVAALEAKTSTQASENENLRDLLGRLQNENLMLKQSAFTFSFPGSGTPGNNNAAQPQRSSSLNSSPANSSNKSSSPASTSLTSARDSPTSGAVNIPSGNNSGSGFTPLLSFSSLANNSNQSANTNSTNGNPPSSTASSTSSLPLTSFFSPPPNVGIQSPYTTIASNPLYTSYTDMSSWDQLMFGDMSGNSDTTMTGSNLSGINPSSTTGSGGMEDLFNTTANYGDLIPFSGFASGNSPVGTMNPIAQSPSVSPIAHASGPMSSFSQLSSGTPHTTAHPASFSQYRSSSPCGGADPDQAPLPGSAHHQPRSNMALTSPQQGEHDTGKCPKTATDFENIIASQPLATLGGSTGPDRHMEMGEVWRKIKEHPQFEVSGASIRRGFHTFGPGEGHGYRPYQVPPRRPFTSSPVMSLISPSSSPLSGHNVRLLGSHAGRISRSPARSSRRALTPDAYVNSSPVFAFVPPMGA